MVTVQEAQQSLQQRQAAITAAQQQAESARLQLSQQQLRQLPRQTRVKAEAQFQVEKGKTLSEIQQAQREQEQLEADFQRQKGEYEAYQAEAKAAEDYNRALRVYLGVERVSGAFKDIPKEVRIKAQQEAERLEPRFQGYSSQPQFVEVIDGEKYGFSMAPSLYEEYTPKYEENGMSIAPSVALGVQPIKDFQEYAKKPQVPIQLSFMDKVSINRPRVLKQIGEGSRNIARGIAGIGDYTPQLERYEGETGIISPTGNIETPRKYSPVKDYKAITFGTIAQRPVEAIKFVGTKVGEGYSYMGETLGISSTRVKDYSFKKYEGETGIISPTGLVTPPREVKLSPVTERTPYGTFVKATEKAPEAVAFLAAPYAYLGTEFVETGQKQRDILKDRPLTEAEKKAFRIEAGVELGFLMAEPTWVAGKGLFGSRTTKTFVKKLPDQQKTIAWGQPVVQDGRVITKQFFIDTKLPGAEIYQVQKGSTFRRDILEPVFGFKPKLTTEVSFKPFEITTPIRPFEVSKPYVAQTTKYNPFLGTLGKPKVNLVAGDLKQYPLARLRQYKVDDYVLQNLFKTATNPLSFPKKTYYAGEIKTYDFWRKVPGKKTQRYIVDYRTRPAGKIGEAKVYDIFMGSKKTKSVFPRASGKVTQQEITYIQLPQKTPKGESVEFIKPSKIKKTPFQSTLQVQEQEVKLVLPPPKVRPSKAPGTVTILEAPKQSFKLGPATTGAYAGLGLYERTEGVQVFGSKFGTGARDNLYLGTIPRTDTKTTQIFKVEGIQEKEFAISISRPRMRELTRVEPSFRQVERLKLKPKQVNELKIGKDIVSQIQTPKRPITSRQTVTVVKPPKPNRLPIQKRKPRKILGQRTKAPKITAEVKKKGVFVPIGKFKDVETATKKGKSILRESLAASLRLKKNGKVIPVAETSAEFRPSKINTNVLVQRKTKRLKGKREQFEILGTRAKRKQKWI